MNEKHEGVSTIAELMHEEDSRSARALVQLVAGALIAIGLMFTGFLNFMLYSRPFPEAYKIFGVIPALLIEGSLATFMLGSFVWFAHGTQGALAKLFGWAMFIIVALNTIVEFNVLAGSATNNPLIDLYAFWGVPVVIPLVIGFWKAVIDTDPDIVIMRQNRKLKQAIKMGKVASVFNHFSSEGHRGALETYGHRVGGDIDKALIGDGQPPELPPAPVHNMSRSEPPKMSPLDHVKAALNGNGKGPDSPNG